MWDTILKPKSFALGGSREPIAKTRQVFNFNGVDQCIELFANVVYAGDYSISFNIVKSSLDAIRVYGNKSNYTGRFVINTDGSANVRPSSDLSDAGFDLPPGSVPDGNSRIEVRRVSDSVEVTINGSKTTFSNANTSDLSINVFGSNASLFGSGVIYDYTDSLGNNYPVDDGWSNNPVIRNTGSGENATLINGLESGWETINL